MSCWSRTVVFDLGNICSIVIEEIYVLGRKHIQFLILEFHAHIIIYIVFHMKIVNVISIEYYIALRC
jgi:hypothetical protein